MEITAAGDNVLRDNAQGILLIVVRGTDDVLRTVKLHIIVLVPGSKRNLISSSAAAKKGGTTVIENNGSSLDLAAFSVHLTRLNSIDYLHRQFEEQSSRRTEPALCVNLRKKVWKAICANSSTSQEAYRQHQH